MGSPAGTAFHFSGTRGPLLGVLHQAPSNGFKGVVLMLPPWGEELNHTRRLARQAATKMAEAGWTVLRYDPWGCGDSGGELGQVTWHDWQCDATLAWDWLTRQAPSTSSGATSHWVWGVRSGALMSAHLLEALNARPHTWQRPRHALWWQPVLHGRHMVQQWQRQRHAASWTRGATAASPAAMAEEPLWVAGQALSPDLQAHMQECKMPGPVSGTQHLVWLDTAADATATATAPSPAHQKTMAAWRAGGCGVHHQTVEGPSYWLTLGQDSATALLDQTLSCMDAAHAPA